MDFSVVVDSFLPIPLNVLSKGAVRQAPPFYARSSLTKCKGWYFGLATVEFLKVKGASYVKIINKILEHNIVNIFIPIKFNKCFGCSKERYQ